MDGITVGVVELELMIQQEQLMTTTDEDNEGYDIFSDMILVLSWMEYLSNKM